MWQFNSRSHHLQKHPHIQDHPLLNKLIYFVSILIPFFTIPQVAKIWYYHNAEGVSLLSWTVYLCASIVWIYYGIVYKEKPIILLNSLMIIMDGAIIIGILRY